MKHGGRLEKGSVKVQVSDEQRIMTSCLQILICELEKGMLELAPTITSLEVCAMRTAHRHSFSLFTFCPLSGGTTYTVVLEYDIRI